MTHDDDDLLSKAAPREALAALHDALAREMAKKLADGTATAADLGVIRQFLKDNGIDALPRRANGLGKLAEQLPFASPQGVDDEEKSQLTH